VEARERVGGLWRDLPAWQDIQIRKEDWTLGDLPIETINRLATRDMDARYAGRASRASSPREASIYGATSSSRDAVE
jgi:hypothetical protein